MKINWKVRIKNKNFWLTIIPAVLLIIQPVLTLLGVTIDLGEIGNALLAIVDAVFVVLALLGIVTDPTTKGIGDSAQAMTYEKPKE
jgi:phi LC3 family holin